MKNKSINILQYTSKNQYSIIVVFFVIVNLILKGLNIGYNSFWLDEVSSVNWSVRPVYEVIEYSFSYPNGPIYQIFLKYWIDLFGIGESWVRGLSLIFGSLTIIPLMLIAKDWFNKNTSYFVALIYTFSNIYLYYSIEARSYTLVSFLATWSFYFFYRIVTEGKPKDILWFVIVNTLLLNTHLTPVFIFVIQVVTSLMFYKSNIKRILWLLLAQALSLVIVGLWVLNNKWFGGNETVWLPIPVWKDILSLLIQYFNSLNNLYIILILVGIIVFYYIRKRNFQNIKNLLIVFLWGILPIIAIFLVSVYYNPRFIPRYMLYAVPGLYLFAAAIINLSFKNLYLQWIVAISFVGIMISQINLKPNKAEKWKEAMEYHNSFKNDSTITVVSADYQRVSFSYYYKQSAFLQYNRIEEILQEDNIFFFNIKRKLQKIISDHSEKKTLIVVLSHNTVVDPEQEALEYLRDNYKQIEYRTDFKGIQIYIFDLMHKVRLHTENIVINKEINSSAFGGISTIDLNLYGSQVNSVRFDFLFEDGFKPEPDARIILEVKRGKASIDYHTVLLKSDIKSYSEKVLLPSEKNIHDSLLVYVWQPKTKSKFIISKVSQTYQVDRSFFYKSILDNKEWMDKIKYKASNQNITIEQQIENEINWIFKQQN